MSDAVVYVSPVYRYVLTVLSGKIYYTYDESLSIVSHIAVILKFR